MLNLIQNKRHGNYNYTGITSHLSGGKNAKVLQCISLAGLQGDSHSYIAGVIQSNTAEGSWPTPLAFIHT